MAAASLKETADYLRFPGETLSQFSTEWKRLSEAERAEIREGIGNGTLTY